jgi:response regulator of citrate/malate metabolism
MNEVYTEKEILGDALNSEKNAMKAGATEVLVKPITLSILRTTLSKYLPDLQW